MNAINQDAARCCAGSGGHRFTCAASHATFRPASRLTDVREVDLLPAVTTRPSLLERDQPAREEG
jgi:hypothetical protein